MTCRIRLWYTEQNVVSFRAGMLRFGPINSAPETECWDTKKKLIKHKTEAEWFEILCSLCINQNYSKIIPKIIMDIQIWLILDLRCCLNGCCLSFLETLFCLPSRVFCVCWTKKNFFLSSHRTNGNLINEFTLHGETKINEWVRVWTVKWKPFGRCQLLLNVKLLRFCVLPFEW